MQEREGLLLIIIIITLDIIVDAATVVVRSMSDSALIISCTGPTAVVPKTQSRRPLLRAAVLASR